MKKRTLLFLLLGLVVAVVLIAAATALETGNSSNLQVWLRAHAHTPLLWMLDGCSVIIFLGIGLLGVAFNGFQEQARQESDDYAQQLDQLLERTEELAKLNDEYARRIADLEEAGEARQESFQSEARRLTEQAFHALSGQVDANARQLDAVNMAMQYQRAELKELRANLRAVSLSASIPQATQFAIAEESAGKALPAPPSETGRQEAATASDSGEASGGVLDQTVNAGSTLIIGTVDFEIPAASPETPSDELPARAKRVASDSNASSSRFGAS